MIRVAVRGWAASTLEPYAEEDWSIDAPEIEAVCVAFRRGDRKALAFYPNEARAVLAGLTSLSNTEDETAEDRERKRRDPEGARMARLASNGFSKLGQRTLAAARPFISAPG